MQGDSGGAAVDVGDDVGLGGHDLLGGDGGGAGDGGAAGVHLDLHAVLVGPLDHGSGVLRLLHAAQADLADGPDAFLGHLGEVRLSEALLQDDAAAVDLHAAGLQSVEGLVGQNGQSLGAGGILGTAGGVALTGGDDGGHAAVELALDEVAGKLAVSIIAQAGVDVSVEQAGGDSGAGGVDDSTLLHLSGELSGGNSGKGVAADGLDLAVSNQDGVTLENRLVDVAAEDGADVLNDCHAHCENSFHLLAGAESAFYHFS